MQEGEIKIESLGKLQAFQSQAQYIRQATKNEYELLMEIKALDHQNQVFNLKMDRLSLQNDINAGKKEVEDYKNMLRIMTLQRDKLEQDNQFKDAEIVGLNDWVKLLQSQKQQITDSFSKEVDQLNTNIEHLESELKNKTSDFTRKQKQLTNQNQRLINQLEELKASSNLMQKDLRSELSQTETLLSEIKGMIFKKFQHLKTEQIQYWNQQDLIDKSLIKLAEFEKLKSKIQAILKNRLTWKISYDVSIESRLEALIEQYEKRVSNFQTQRSELQSFLNRQIEKYVKKHQNCYNEELKVAISNTFIDLNCKITGLTNKIKEIQNEKCKSCEKSENQIKSLRNQLSLQKKNKQDIQKSFISTLQTCQRQNKKALDDLKKQNKKIQIQLSQSKQKIQKTQNENQKITRLLSEEKRKIQSVIEDRQRQQQNSQKLSRDLYNLNLSYEQLAPQVEKYKKALQQKQEKLKQGDKLIQDAIQNSSRKITQLQQEICQKIQQLISLQATKNQISDQYLYLQKKQQQKTNQIDEIDNKLCKLANMNCLGKQDNQAKSYSQAFVIIEKFLENPPGKSLNPLFKMPSISSRFEESLDWLTDTIGQFTEKGKNFNTVFLGKTTQAGSDFKGYLENQNVLLICSNSKQATFQIFITKLCKGINDKFKIALLSAEKRLRYPKSADQIKGNIRPSTLNTLGQLVFGRQQLTINRNLQMIAVPNATGYFVGLDIRQMFGIDSSTEKPIIEAIQFYQIVYE